MRRLDPFAAVPDLRPRTRIVIEVHAELRGANADDAGRALVRLLRMADGALEGVKVRDAVVLGRGGES